MKINGNTGRYFSDGGTSQPRSASISPRKGISRLKATNHLGILPIEFDLLAKEGKMPLWKWVDGRKVWHSDELDRFPRPPRSYETLDDIFD